MTSMNKFAISLRLLLISSLWALASYQANEFIVVEACISLILFSLAEISQIRTFTAKIIPLLCIAICLLISYKLPNLLFFLPCLILNIPNLFTLSICLIVSMLFAYSQLHNLALLILLSCFSLWAYLSEKNNESGTSEQSAYLQTIDVLQGANQKLNKLQAQLIAQQDKLIEQSFQKERLRLTSEIHDILGHQLTSCIVQLKALELTSPSYDFAQNLHLVSAQLQNAMQNVRKVIHSEHSKALNLETELKSICASFPNLEIDFRYSANCPLKAASIYSILSIVRECLTNTTKHSQAKNCKIYFQENNDSFSLFVADNGQTNNNPTHSDGIGLSGINRRVQEMQGKLNLCCVNGYRYFIQIPKEVNANENSHR